MAVRNDNISAWSIIGLQFINLYLAMTKPFNFQYNKIENYMSEKYKNYVGNEIDFLDELKEAFDSFNHFVSLDPKYVFGPSLRGWFYTNVINGESYVISSYGIGNYTENGLKWCLNDESKIRKFLNVNAKISMENDEPVYENSLKKKQIKQKLGL